MTNSDWNFLPFDPPALYPSGFDGVHVTVNDMDYGVPSTFSSLSDSGSNEPRPLPSSLVPSPSNSQGKNSPDEHSIFIHEIKLLTYH